MYTCPFFNDEVIDVDYLPAEIGFSIYPKPTKMQSSNYIDGNGGIYQYAFDLVCNENMDGMIENSIANSRFFEDFQNWVMEQVKGNKFPEIKDIQVLDVTIVNTGYFQSVVQAGLGQYVVSLILEYEKGVI